MTNSQFRPLLKLMIKQNFNLKVNTANKKRTIATVAAVAIAVLPLAVIMCVGIYIYSAQMNELGLFRSFLSMIFTATQLMVFFFGMASLLSVMFFSRDNEFLQTLPINRMTIIVCKLIIVYLSELLISTIVLLPCLIVAGVGIKTASAAYWILSMIGIALNPVLPLLVAAILSFPLFYIVTFFRKNNTLATILGIAFFAAIMTGYMFLVGSISNGADNGAGATIEQLLKPIETMGKIIYPNYLFAGAMSNSGNFFANIGIYAAIILAMTGAALALAYFIYNISVKKLQEVGIRKKRGKSKERDVKKSTVIVALLKREIKCISRDTSIAFNTLMGCVMTPLMILIISLGTNGIADEKISKGAADMLTMGMMMYMSMIMLNGMNFAATIAFSREGGNFSVLKTLPVEPELIVKSKILLADMMIVIGSVISAIIMIATRVASVPNALVYCVANFIFGTAISALAVKRDLKKPKLNWISMREITNRNFSAMVPMFICMFVGIIYMILAVLMGSFLYKLIGAWCWVIYWGVIIITSLIANAVFRHNMSIKAVELFNDIEV